MGPATLTMTLNDLRIGQSARITQLNELDCNACRLMEMGLCPGTEVIWSMSHHLATPFRSK